MVLNRMAKGQHMMETCKEIVFGKVGHTENCCFVFNSGVKEIDIAATLEHIRDQRPGMVRTKVMKDKTAELSPISKIKALLYP